MVNDPPRFALGVVYRTGSVMTSAGLELSAFLRVRKEIDRAGCGFRVRAVGLVVVLNATARRG